MSNYRIPADVFKASVEAAAEVAWNTQGQPDEDSWGFLFEDLREAWRETVRPLLDAAAPLIIAAAYRAGQREARQQDGDSRCWCGGEVGPRVPGDAEGIGCLTNIHHLWRDRQQDEATT
jgi:hypothetical protein